MGGPIIRVGSTPEFADGWDNIFGDKKGKKKAGAKRTAAKKKSPAKKKKAKKSK